ncbi:MAG: hypothetical protein R3Y13_02610 [bacterium]
MIQIIKKEIGISDNLKKEIKLLGAAFNTKYKINKGYLKQIRYSNVGYIVPHSVEINERIYLFYNDKSYFKEYGKEDIIPMENLINYVSNNN